jgi:hypothetical protein
MAMSSVAFASGETKTETVNENNNLTVTARGNGDVTNADNGADAYLGLTAYDAAVIQYYAEQGIAVDTDDITKGDINGIHTKAAGAVDAADAQMVLNLVRKPIELDTANKARVLTAVLNSEVPTLSLGEKYSDTTTLIDAVDALIAENKDYITGENALLKKKGINPLRILNNRIRDTKFPVTSLPDGFDLDDLGFTPRELVNLLGKDTIDLDVDSLSNEQLINIYNNNKDLIIAQIKAMNLDGATIRKLMNYTGNENFEIDIDKLTDDQVKTYYENNKNTVLEIVKSKDFDAATIKEIMKLAGKSTVEVDLLTLDDTLLKKLYEDNKDSIIEGLKANENIDATTIKSIMKLAGQDPFNVAPSSLGDAELQDAYKKNKTDVLNKVKAQTLDISLIKELLVLSGQVTEEQVALLPEETIRTTYDNNKDAIFDKIADVEFETTDLRDLIAASGIETFAIPLDDMENERLTNLYNENKESIYTLVKYADLDAETLRSLIKLSGKNIQTVEVDTLSDELVKSAYDSSKDTLFETIKDVKLTGEQIREIVKLTGETKFNLDLTQLTNAQLEEYYNNNKDLVLEMVKDMSFTVDEADKLREIIALTGQKTFSINISDLTDEQVEKFYENNKDTIVDLMQSGALKDLNLEFGFSDEGGWSVFKWALQPALDLNKESGDINMAKLFEIVKKTENEADADRITYDDLKTVEGLIKETFSTAVLTGTDEATIRKAFEETKERVLSIVNTKKDVTSTINAATAITAKNISKTGAEEKVAAVDGSIGYAASIDDIVDAILDNKLYLYESKTIGDVTGVFGTWVGANKKYGSRDLSSKVEIYSEAAYDSLKK